MFEQDKHVKCNGSIWKETCKKKDGFTHEDNSTRNMTSTIVICQKRPSCVQRDPEKHTFIYIYICVYMYEYVYIYMYIYVYMYMYTCIYICIYIYIHTYVHVHLHPPALSLMSMLSTALLVKEVNRTLEPRATSAATSAAIVVVLPVHTHTHTHTQINTYMYMYINISTYIYIHIHVQ